MKSNILLQLIVSITLLGVIPSRVHADDPSLAAKIQGQRVFTSPIEWIGEQEPPLADSAGLLQAISAFDGGGTKTGYTALENFLQRYPQSSWAPSLRTHLAERYRMMGRYTAAMNHWETAWESSKDGTDAGSRKIAARALTGWMRLLGSLGQKAKLGELLDEAEQRNLAATSYAPLLLASREGLSVMKGRPGDVYRCGSLALSQVIKLLSADTKAYYAVRETPSPDGGFRMSELLVVAASNRCEVVAVQRVKGDEIPVPSVVHWKLDHYAAIVEKRDGRYKVIDPTFDAPAWMDAHTINEEASGYFLVSPKHIPAQSRRLTPIEATAVRGKGYTYTADDASDNSGDDEDNDDCDPPDANDGPEGGGEPCPPGAGMPVWRVSDPHITLWIHDVPLYYRSARGGWVKLRLSYKHRTVPRNDNTVSFGDNWECNWVGFTEEDSAQPATIKNYLAGGGTTAFATNGTAEFWTARQLTKYSSGAPIRIASAGAGRSGTPSSAFGGVNVNQGLLHGPASATSPIGGSDNHYGFQIVYGGGISRYFLTNRIDRYGRIQHYDYIDVTVDHIDYIRLSSTKDKDGKVSTLSYTNAAFPHLVTAVTDPYGRTARFFYDTNKFLTNIVDVAGLSSFFMYDSSGKMTNMVTPYGTNSFSYFSQAGDPGFWSRGLEVTEPTGEKQFSVYHEGSANGTYSPNMWHHMHTYHWNRKQYAALSVAGKAAPLTNMTVADFDLAPRTEWLRTDSDSSVALLIGSPWKKHGPVDAALGQRSDNVQYTYPGQNNNVPQTFNRVVSINWGNGDQMEVPRNNWGRPTEIKYYRNGQWVSFTNEYNADGRRLEQVWGPAGERVRAYGYHPSVTNLLTSVTNAAGDVIRYTHDASARVTSITHPGGMVTTNIYYTSGTYAGFLQTRMDIGFHTNHYTWSNGNLEWHTNELGLATKRTWDNLNRLTSIFYPHDNTTVSNVYNNLDLSQTKDRLDHWTRFGYNRLRQLIARTNANDRVTEWDWCNCGSPSEITEWNGTTPIITQYAYDIAGRLTNVVFPDGYALNYKYDLSSRVTETTDSALTKLAVGYTDYGQMAWTQLSGSGASGGTLLARTYDTYGRLATATDRNSVTTTFAYDVLGRITNQTVLNGGTPSIRTFGWTAVGLTNSSDELNRTNWLVHDAAGRLLFETNAENQVLRFTYNPADQLLTLTDGKSQVTKWNYNSEAHVTNKVDATTAEIFRYKYDADARLTNRWTAAKGDTFYSYDAIGNLTGVDYPSTVMDITLQYDALDRMTNVADASGTTKFTYTAAGQLLSEDGPWNQDTVSYSYAHRQRNVLSLLQPNASPWTQTYVYDGIARLSSAASAAGSFGYAYISAVSDRIQTLNLPGAPGNKYISQDYDSLARVTQTRLFTPFASPANGHSYQYNEAHQRTKQTFDGNNYIDYAYDKIGQLKSAKGWEAGGATARLQEQAGYAYDNAWNLQYRTNNALVQTFNTDNRNQLTTATRSGTLTVAGSAGYVGPASLPVTVTVSGTGLSSGAATVYADQTWARTNATLVNGNNTYTAMGQDNSGRTSVDTVAVNLPATVTFQYDGNGNLTNDGRRVFEYDYENQLTNAYVASAWRSEFKYDAFGRRRVRKEYAWNGSWTLTNEVRYVYDGMLAIQERDANNLAIVSYTRGNDLSGSLQTGGGIGGLLARSEMSNLQSPHAYYHADGKGNVTAMVNTNGALVALYHYDSYGNLLGMAGPLAEANTYRFSSKEWHGSAGVYYYGYRYYEPNLQRWLNSDQIAEKGGINLFALVANVPVNAIDAYGECPLLLAIPALLSAEAGVAVGGSIIAAGVGIGIGIAITSPGGVRGNAPPGVYYNGPGGNAAPSVIVSMGQKGRGESGVRTTPGNTKADDKARGERGSGRSGDKEKPSKPETDAPPEQPDPLRGIREHFDKNMPPKDGAPARPSCAR